MSGEGGVGGELPCMADNKLTCTILSVALTPYPSPYQEPFLIGLFLPPYALFI